MTPKIITCVVGARPNFMKMAPVLRACEERPALRTRLVHTGQHYDRAMSELFFEQLGMPKPHRNLEAGSASHAQQTSLILAAFEGELLEHPPDLVLVAGDVNSTLACALVANKLGIPVAHLEAGLRSFDRTMPEEVNRLLTDALSDILLCTEPSALCNLHAEGYPVPDCDPAGTAPADREPARSHAHAQVHLVGNTMVDSLLQHLERARCGNALATAGVEPGRYAVLTMHRPSNVDPSGALPEILHALEVIQRDLPILFPVHPRTRAQLASPEVTSALARCPELRLLEPLGYLDFVQLMDRAALVLTDSGGIQEETTILGVPCLTLRENTERPITLSRGTNQLAGTTRTSILAAYGRARGREPVGERPDLWDGRAAVRVADVLEQRAAAS